MKKGKAWHQDDRFWKIFAPVMFHPQRWDRAVEEVNCLLGLLGVEPGAALLDLCCGPGRHSLELARRGYRVTGVDRNTTYLRQARQTARGDKLAAEFVREDMRRFVRREAFDGAINLFTSFGYFEDPADDRRVLQNVRRSLKPGGTLVMDLMGKEVLARIFTLRTWDEHPDGTVMLQEHKVTRNWSWSENRWILLKGGRRREFCVSHRLYAAAELIRLLRDCGFRSADAFGDLTGVPYDNNARRLVVVATR